MMPDFETDCDVGYHWSPSTRREAIEREGLRVGAAPAVNGVEDGHRNSYISLSPTPAQAWWLSGGALFTGGFASESPTWDLYEVDINGLDAGRLAEGYPEIQVREDISADRVERIALRAFTDCPDADWDQCAEAVS